MVDTEWFANQQFEIKALLIKENDVQLQRTLSMKLKLDVIYKSLYVCSIYMLISYVYKASPTISLQKIDRFYAVNNL